MQYSYEDICDGFSFLKALDLQLYLKREFPVNIAKFLRTGVVYNGATWYTFHTKLEKQKNPPEKKPLLFHEMELSSSNIKKILIFQETETPRKDPPEKTSYTSGNENPEKASYNFSKESFSYISENGNPEKNCLYFRKRKFFIFQQ